jgi:hypothetical protein
MKNKECRWIGVLLLLVLVGCGDDKAPQTEFGSVKSVRAYREVVEDIIVEANAIEQDFRETAVGSTGQATGNNLSDTAMRLRPRLLAAIDELDRVKVPQKLVETHADVHAALMLRLVAFDLMIEGWSVEQQQTFDKAQPLYVDATKKLNEATGILNQLNEVLLEVDIALAEAESRTLVG